MIIVCMSCLPERTPTNGVPWAAYRVTCAICNKIRDAMRTYYVDASVEDVKFDKWCETFTDGPKEKRT